MPFREVVVYSKSSVILLFLLSILVVVAGAQLAQSANASGCGFGAAELQSELDKSISHFDQGMNGEWRALNQRVCTLQAAMLLDVYNLEDVRSEKKGDNRGALFFHAGQLSRWQVPHMSPFGAFKVLWTQAKARRRSRSYRGTLMCLQPSDFSNGTKKRFDSNGNKLR